MRQFKSLLALLVLATAVPAYGESLGYVTLKVTAKPEQWGVHIYKNDGTKLGDTALGPYDYTLGTNDGANGSLDSNAWVKNTLFNKSGGLTTSGYCIEVERDITVGKTYSNYEVHALTDAFSDSAIAKKVSYLWTNYENEFHPTGGPSNHSYRNYALGLAIWEVVDSNLERPITSPTPLDKFFSSTGPFGATWWKDQVIKPTEFGGNGTTMEDLSDLVIQTADKWVSTVGELNLDGVTVSPSLYAIMKTGTQNQAIAFGKLARDETVPEPGACAALIGIALSLGGAFVVRRRRETVAN